MIPVLEALKRRLVYIKSELKSRESVTALTPGSPCPSRLCCRLLTWVWTSALRESLWATDQTVSHLRLASGGRSGAGWGRGGATTGGSEDVQ